MTRRHKNYLPLIIFGVISLLIYVVGTMIPETTIREIVSSAGPFSVLVLIFLIWLTNIIAPLSAAPFLFAGFYLFGPTVVIYAYIAAFIASITNFWIARIWGRSLVERLAGQDSLKTIDKLTKNYGFQTLIITRIFLSQFYDVISYLFGLTSMRFTPYLIISTLGTIPGSVLWYFLSTKINNPLAFTVISITFSYSFLSIYIIWANIATRKLTM